MSKLLVTGQEVSRNFRTTSKVKIEKPLPLKSIPRNYSQYGIPKEILLNRLSSIERPDVICITSGMTYWYPGLFKTIEIIMKFFREVPIILGGIYATLCHEHAIRHSEADFVFKGRGEWKVLKLISELTRIEITPNSELQTDDLPYPAFDLYPQLDYVCLSTSKGCSLRCSYCASHFLTIGFIRRDPLKVVEEIEYWTSKYRINNIAFYDDALITEPKEHIIPILKEIVRKRIRCNFHTPNGLHVRELEKELADLLFRSGFKTIRLGFETSNEAIQIETGGKVDNKDFKKVVKHLMRAGYSGEEIGVYIMAGLPGQIVEEVEASIIYVKEMGAKPMLVEYSPIPNTPMFEKAKQMSSFDIQNEPLFHNNSILPCQWEGFTFADYKRLKEDTKRK